MQLLITFNLFLFNLMTHFFFNHFHLNPYKGLLFPTHSSLFFDKFVIIHHAFIGSETLFSFSNFNLLLWNSPVKVKAACNLILAIERRSFPTKLCEDNKPKWRRASHWLTWDTAKMWPGHSHLDLLQYNSQTDWKRITDSIWYCVLWTLPGNPVQLHEDAGVSRMSKSPSLNPLDIYPH